MKGITNEQAKKIEYLSKFKKVSIRNIVDSLYNDFGGKANTCVREQLLFAYIDGKPNDKEILTTREQWLIRHLIDNVRLTKTPSRPYVSEEVSKDYNKSFFTSLRSK